MRCFIAWEVTESNSSSGSNKKSRVALSQATRPSPKQIIKTCAFPSPLPGKVESIWDFITPHYNYIVKIIFISNENNLTIDVSLDK
jgi:hypothetical protein